MRQRKTLILPVILISLFISGCNFLEPTYTKEKIVDSIINICKEEYDAQPHVWLLGETVWIYLPMPRLVTKDLAWDSETMNKIGKVTMGASRVLLSMKPRPQFLVLVASDTTELGIDYITISWIPDIVKFQLELISRDEFLRRHVIRVKDNTVAIGDTAGRHIIKDEIKLQDFLAAQIAQRINNKFSQEEPFKGHFETKDYYGIFEGDTFKIYAYIKQTEPLPQGPIDIQREMNKVIAYVIREYDFKDFLLAEAENTATGDRTAFSRLALRQFL